MFALVLIGVLVVVNLAISWWNAKAVGTIWVESKQAGGWYRFMAWMGAIMSAAGFTWSYLVIIGLGLGYFHVLDLEQLQYLFDVGYVTLIPFVLFAGYAITFDSWRIAFHERSLGGYGVAGWNTFASAYNTYNAVQGFGPALGNVFNGLGKVMSKSGKSAGYVAILIVFLLILTAGITTTAALIHHYAAREDLAAIEQRAQIAKLYR